MMIVMHPDASPEQVEAVRARVAETGVHVLVMPGELTTAIGAIGDPEAVRQLALEGMAGVDRVVPISRPYKLAALELGHRGPSAFEIGGHVVGGGETFCLIAGPCTVETREQTIGVARAVRAAGAAMLRGGAFKPRTSPFAFKGLGAQGLEILAEAREETGLPVVTEFLDTTHADVIAEHADVVQIGARNMQNYALLEVAGKLGKPVLLKRGLSSSLDELLQAADYVLKEGTEEVILCERGIRTFETSTRFTLDLGAIPWLKLHTHLPVVVDPSHAAGDRRLVEPLSRAAAAVGADGIIVEVHEDPEHALCDGPQALYARDFGQYAADVAAHAGLLGRRLAGLRGCGASPCLPGAPGAPPGLPAGERSGSVREIRSRDRTLGCVGMSRWVPRPHPPEQGGPACRAP
jgi:3-deoxy-7-phosphoheptulonate synthase